jgi:hypothetical protein
MYQLTKALGFHLADGTLYTYLLGDEYEDIAAASGWNLIPGGLRCHATQLHPCRMEWARVIRRRRIECRNWCRSHAISQSIYQSVQLAKSLVLP